MGVCQSNFDHNKVYPSPQSPQPREEYKEETTYKEVQYSCYDLCDDCGTKLDEKPNKPKKKKLKKAQPEWNPRFPYKDEPVQRSSSFIGDKGVFYVRPGTPKK